MTYITKCQDGAPEWIGPMVLCKVRDNKDAEPRNTRYIKMMTRDNLFVDEKDSFWPFAEPVEAWQPQEGDIVAAWDDGQTAFCIAKYKCKTEIGRYKTNWYVNSPATWQHVARLVYPDGRVIDCACDVEELKRRTGEGNWI